MKVVLFDPLTDGHHVEYAGYLGRYLLEQGDSVRLVAWAPAQRLEALRSALPGLDVQYLTQRTGERFGSTPTRYYSQMLWAVERAVNLAIKEGAHVFHHLFVERAEVPMRVALATHGRSLRAFGTLFWPYFLHGPAELGVPTRAVHAANRLALRRMLRTGSLRTLFVHSPRVRAQVLAALGEIPPHRIVVVPDPAVPPVGSRAAARDWLGLPEGMPVFLFLGQLSERKGADLLLQALPRLEQMARGDWRVVMAGLPGSVGESDVERWRERLRDPERLITRLGFAPDEDIDRYFLAADAVVLPYRRSHLGTSGILQRAAAAGRVVIVSNVGDLGPTVREHDLGMVVEPEDHQALVGALRTFIDNHERIQERTGPRALTYAAGASWQIVGERVRAQYLVTSRNRRPNA